MCEEERLFVRIRTLRGLEQACPGDPCLELFRMFFPVINGLRGEVLREEVFDGVNIRNKKRVNKCLCCRRVNQTKKEEDIF